MADKVYLAIDLGVESGRVMAGIWNGKKLRLEEVHRFPNGPVALGETIRWYVLRLWAEIQNGLTLAGKKFGKQIVSVGADTWGVDFVLLTKNDEIVGMPYHYRDARTNGVMERVQKCFALGDFCADRAAVHAVEYAVSTARDAGAESRVARPGGLPVAHAGLPALVSVRIALGGIH